MSKYSGKRWTPVFGNVPRHPSSTVQGSGPSAGLTLQAGANLVDIATTYVTNSSVIHLSTERFAPSSETILFHGFGVRSVNPGVGFTVGPVTSVATLTASYRIHWSITRLG